MASSERDMRKTVVQLLKPLHAVSVENGCGIGTPDVNYRDGWIELKSVDMPARHDTIVNVDHFTQHQRLWLRMRERSGGVALLLLKVDTTWLLYRGSVAADIVGKSTMWELMKNSARIWPAQTPTQRGLIEALSKIRRDLQVS